MQNLISRKFVLNCLAMVLVPIGSIAAANVFEIDLVETEPLELKVPIYTVFNHNTATWDREESTREATRRLLRWSDRNAVSTLMTVHSEAVENEASGKKYFLDSRDVDLTVLSEQGAHRLRSLNAEAILLSGGYLEDCLCRFLRDFLLGADFNGKTLNIVYLMDAVYTDGTRRDYGSPRSGNSLAHFLADEGAEFTAAYFFRRVIKPDVRFCGYSHPKIEDYSFTVIINGQDVATQGRGEKRVNILMAKVSDLEGVEKTTTDPSQLFKNLIKYQNR